MQHLSSIPPLHLSEAYSSYCTVSYNHLHLCISLYLCEFLQFVIMRSYLYCYLSLGLNGPPCAPLCHGIKCCLFVYLFSGSISATNAFQHCSFPLNLVPILHLLNEIKSLNLLTVCVNLTVTPLWQSHILCREMKEDFFHLTFILYVWWLTAVRLLIFNAGPS